MELHDQEANNLANHGRRKTTIPIHLKSNSSPKPSRSKTRSRGSRSRKPPDSVVESKLSLLDGGLDDDIENINIPSIKPAADEPLHKNKRLNWDHPVKQLGAKIVGDYLFCCQLCELPILVYGRIMPCRHTFCNDCARKGLEKCPRCNQAIHHIEQSAIGTVFICTHGAPQHSHEGCKRSYLSTRDLQAHIEFRHQVKTSSTSTSKLSPSTTAPSVGTNEQRESSRSTTAGGQSSTQDSKVHQTQIITPHVPVANRSPVSAQIVTPLQTNVGTNNQNVLGSTIMLAGQDNQRHFVPSTVMAPGQTMLHQQTSIPGTNAPQMQPQIQQQAQQPILNNLTGLNSMNRPPPINMMQQGNMQQGNMQQGNMQQSSMPQGNMQQTQQNMPLQGMPSLPQPTPPSQVARIALANHQQGINHAPMLVPPLRPGAPLRASLGQGHPGGPPQGTGPVGPGEARHMGSGAPQIESYHSSNPTSQVLGRGMDNLIPIQEDQNYQSSADRSGYQQQSYQVTPSNIRFPRSSGLPSTNIPSTSMPQAPPPLQQNQQTSQGMQGQRMMYNNQQMTYPSSRNMNPGDHPTSPQVMSHGSQPPMQQNSGGHYPPASGSSVHRQPGFNQGGPGMWNRPPRGSSHRGAGGGGGPIRHPRGRSQRNYYN